MPRVQKVELQAALARLCRAFNLQPETKPGEGGYSIDHYALGGGYMVVSREAGRSGERHPFYSGRLPAPAFLAALQFAASVGEHLQNEGHPITQGVKPASMFDAKVIATVKKLLHSYDTGAVYLNDLDLTVEDLRLLRQWVGK